MRKPVPGEWGFAERWHFAKRLNSAAWRMLFPSKRQKAYEDLLRLQAWLNGYDR